MYSVVRTGIYSTKLISAICSGTMCNVRERPFPVLCRYPSYYADSFLLACESIRFSFALRRWGHFARRKTKNVPSGEEQRRNGCFRRLAFCVNLKSYPVNCRHSLVVRCLPAEWETAALNFRWRANNLY